MARVIDAEVKAILPTEIDTSPFITAATLMVDRLDATVLSPDELKEIERWLSAHLACMADPRLHSFSTGGSSATYEGQTGLGLDHTRYGQQVKLLDRTKALVSLDKKRASITVV